MDRRREMLAQHNALQNLYNGNDKTKHYIAYSSMVIGSAGLGDNYCANFHGNPNTTYKIELNMYSRFRVATYTSLTTGNATAKQKTTSVYDTNTSGGYVGKQSLEITTGANDVWLYVFYWTQTDEVEESVIRESIRIYEA